MIANTRDPPCRVAVASSEFLFLCVTLTRPLYKHPLVFASFFLFFFFFFLSLGGVRLSLFILKEATKNKMSSSSRHLHRQRERPGATGEIRVNIPPYESPLYPLNDAAKQRLTTILQGSSLRNLQTHLEHAEAKINDSGGEVNERLAEAKMRYQRVHERKKNKKNGGEENENGGGDVADEGEESEEDRRKLAETEDRVKAVTAKLDESVRKAIDTEFKIGELKDAVTELITEENNRDDGGREQRPPPRDSTDGGENGDHNNEQEGEEGRVKREHAPNPPVNPPSAKLKEKLDSQIAGWEALSLGER